MLSKLLKHEIKATSRFLLPLYLVLLVLTILDSIALRLDIFEGTLSFVPKFITVIYGISLFAILVATFLIMVIRFYKNYMTDEGYLMFTLPVNSHQLILSKLLVSFLWYIVTAIAVIASLFAVLYRPGVMHELWIAFKLGLTELNLVYSGKASLFITEFTIMMIISIVNGMLLIYLSIAIGQLFNGHKIIGAFVSYMGIYTALQIISMFCIAIIGTIFKDSIYQMNRIPMFILPIVILITLLLSVIYYFGTTYIFRNKLNLE